MKKSLLAAIAVALIFSPTWTQAFCTQSGHVERVTVAPSSGISTILLRNTPVTENLRWAATTTDDKIVEAALHALTSRTNVAITAGTSFSVCPTFGLERAMGVVTTITLSP